MTETVYILMGSNLGDRQQCLASALARMESLPGLEVIATSGIYLSEAEGMGDDCPPFMNQVVKGEYRYRPSELLRALEVIEKSLGRTGKGRCQPRTIDLDILMFGNDIIETERLRIPHPELLNRPFAMVPLLQIDPDVTHPETGRPVAEYLTDADREQVVVYKDHVPRFI